MEINPGEQLLMFSFMDLWPKVLKKKNLEKDKSEHRLI